MEELQETLRAAREPLWPEADSDISPFWPPSPPGFWAPANPEWSEVMNALLKDIHSNVMWC